MQHMGGEDDQKLQEQMKKIDEDLKDKMDEMEDLEAMNQTLLVKERKCSDELQEACKVLTEGLENFKDVKDLDGKVLPGQTSLGTIVCAIIVPGAGIWLGCDSRTVKVSDDFNEHVVVQSDKSMKYQILRAPGKPPIVGMASGNSLRIKNLWKAIHTKVKDGSDTIGKVVNEVMLHLESNPHAKHFCSVLLAGFYSEKECFVVVRMGDKRSIEFYPSPYGIDPQYQVSSGSGGKFAQKYLLKWMSERTTTDNINALKGKALKLIKSALIEAVTYDAGCGGNLNVLWLNGQDVEETSFTALNLLLDNCGTALDPSLYFFFTREKEEVINYISLGKLLKPYGFQKKDAISGFGTVVGNLWAMFLVKVPAKVKFEKACIHLPDSILDQVMLENSIWRHQHQVKIHAKYQVKPAYERESRGQKFGMILNKFKMNMGKPKLSASIVNKNSLLQVQMEQAT